MSRFLTEPLQTLRPYQPGEQPQNQEYLKLNTNESPYGPSPHVLEQLKRATNAGLARYPDPNATQLRAALARYYGLDGSSIFVGGGSDEILAYFFMAFFKRGDTVHFPAITYQFYQVYANLFGLQASTIPLTDQFTIDLAKVTTLPGHLILCNPNAPTGIALTPAQIEPIVAQNKNRLVLIDEAYVDFSDGKSCMPLLSKYDNLLIVRTYSKSRSLAGMRIGMAMADPQIIQDLDRIKNSFNPYHLSKLAITAGIAALEDEAYFTKTVQQTVDTRGKTAVMLSALGFTVLPSETNFLLVRHATRSGAFLYQALKKQGVLVRHFNQPGIECFLRITIGLPEQLEQLEKALRSIV